MIMLLIASSIPMPSGFVVKKLSKMRSRFAGQDQHRNPIVYDDVALIAELRADRQDEPGDQPVRDGYPRLN
jgi:hypothetical protein